MRIQVDITFPEERRVYYRHPHDKEVFIPGPSARSPDRYYTGNSNGIGRDTKGRTIPEPFRIFPDHQTPLNCDWQRLIREVNPEHRDDVTDKVLDHHWVLANLTGIGEVGRKNCRNGDYMNDSTAKWPALHTAIVTGGALFCGVESQEVLRIESLLTTDPAPDAQYVLERPWLFFYLTELNSEGRITYMTLGTPSGERMPVRMPLISEKPLYIPLKWVQKMPEDFNIATYDPRSFL